MSRVEKWYRSTRAGRTATLLVSHSTSDDAASRVPAPPDRSDDAEAGEEDEVSGGTLGGGAGVAVIDALGPGVVGSGETTEVTGAGLDGPDAPVGFEALVFPDPPVDPAVAAGSVSFTWTLEVLAFGRAAGPPGSLPVHPIEKQVTKVVVRLVRWRSRILRSRQWLRVCCERRSVGERCTPARRRIRTFFERVLAVVATGNVFDQPSPRSHTRGPRIQGGKVVV